MTDGLRTSDPPKAGRSPSPDTTTPHARAAPRLIHRETEDSKQGIRATGEAMSYFTASASGVGRGCLKKQKKKQKKREGLALGLRHGNNYAWRGSGENGEKRIGFLVLGIGKSDWRPPWALQCPGAVQGSRPENPRFRFDLGVFGLARFLI